MEQDAGGVGGSCWSKMPVEGPVFMEQIDRGGWVARVQKAHGGGNSIFFGHTFLTRNRRCPFLGLVVPPYTSNADSVFFGREGHPFWSHRCLEKVGAVICFGPTNEQSRGDGMFSRGGVGVTHLPDLRSHSHYCWIGLQAHIRLASTSQVLMGIGANPPFASDAEKGYGDSQDARNPFHSSLEVSKSVVFYCMQELLRSAVGHK